MIKFVPIFLVLSMLSVAAIAAPNKVWEIKHGLAQPESTYYEPTTKTIFVSNVAGDPFTKDGKGWITQLSVDGKVLKEKWAEGMHAPKGLRSHQGKLWVSDIDRVLVYNIPDGKLLQTIPVTGAKFLNDVAIAKDGSVYVSDTVTGTIHLIKGDKVSTFVTGKNFAGPNGLLVAEPYLRVAAWGTDVKADLSAKGPGALYNIHLKTKKKSPLLDPLGNLDGIEALGSKQGGGLLVSDWVAGKVYRTGKSNKPVETLLEGLKGAADIGYVEEKGLLLVPEMGADRVAAYQLDTKKIN